MRRQGWESLLGEYLRANEAREFAWGRHDCALFAATWVLLCTGRDLVSEWAGEYASATGALRLMRRRGFSAVEQIAETHLEETPVRLAGRGDVILHPQGALGVCNGLKSYFLTFEGMDSLPTLACPRAWKVG